MRNTNNLDFSAIKDGIRKFAKKAGRVATRPVLLLYFVMKSDKTPKSDKLLILSTLAYLVVPIDIISAKRLPIIGWLDEVASLSVAIQKMSQHITPEVERKTDEVLDSWFAEYTEYVEVEKS
jgi:uncharacterized membrane protein YkvA (DUF1232 family)